jgi:flagellar biosynthesis protein FliR
VVKLYELLILIPVFSKAQIPLKMRSALCHITVPHLKSYDEKRNSTRNKSAAKLQFRSDVSE